MPLRNRFQWRSLVRYPIMSEDVRGARGNNETRLPEHIRQFSLALAEIFIQWKSRYALHLPLIKDVLNWSTTNTKADNVGRRKPCFCKVRELCFRTRRNKAKQSCTDQEFLKICDQLKRSLCVFYVIT